MVFNQLARSSEAYQYILLLSFSSLHASRPLLISPFLSLQFQPLLQNALKEAPPVALATVQVEGVVEVEAVEGLVTAGIRVVAGGVEEEDLIAIVTTIVNIRLPRQPQFSKTWCREGTTSLRPLAITLKLQYYPAAARDQGFKPSHLETVTMMTCAGVAGRALEVCFNF